MARLLVNKHFNDHESAKNGFSTLEEHKEHVFGEIIICNDSTNPSIYIKDSEMNSVAIGDVVIESKDKILSKENKTIKSTIGLIWDEAADCIKLIGKDDVMISEIPIFGVNNIADKIDNTVTRIVEVNSILTDSVNHPEGTEEGKNYLEIKVFENGEENAKYIQFLSPDNIFSIEGTEVIPSTEDVKGTEGDINVGFDEELNKYVVSHGEVSPTFTSSSTNTFGSTSFIKDLEINKLGHITSVVTGTLPSLPSRKILVNSVTGETAEDYYVSSVGQSVDDMKIEVEYTKFPEVKVGVNATENGEKTTKFVSSISETGEDSIDVTYSEVKLDDFVKRGELDQFVTDGELDSKLANLGITDEEGNVREVVVTVDDSECGEGKYVSDIDVDETDKTKLYLRTKDLGLNKYVSKSELTEGSNDLEWNTAVTLMTVGDKSIKAKLPVKPGVSVSVEENNDAAEVLVGVNTSEGETDEMVFTKRKLDFANLMYKKNVSGSTATLQWPSDGKSNETTIATIGDKEIKVALPEPIEVTVEDGETVDSISNIITDIDASGHVLTLHKGSVNFKDYVSQNELSEKHYITAADIEIVDSENEVSDSETFIKSISATTDETNKVDIVVEYGKSKAFDIDDKVTYTPTPTLVWGDAENGTEGVSVVKIGNKDVKIKLPNEPKVDVDGKIVTYDIDSELIEKKLTVALKGSEGGVEKTELDKTTSIDLPFVLSGEVNNYVSLSATTAENTAPNTFVKDITVNGNEITPVFGEISYDFDVVNNHAELPWGTETEIAKINGTSITVKTLVPEKGEGADGNTKYELSGSEVNKVYKIELKARENDDTSSTATIDLTPYVKDTEVETIVGGMLADAGKVKDVHVNNSSVLDTEGIAKIDLTKYVTDGELPDFNEFAKTGDLPDFNQFALKEDIPVIEVVNNNAVLQWGEPTDIAKINGTTITVTTLVPEAGEGADGNTKYQLSGSEENKVYKIELTAREGDDTSSSATINLTDYVKDSEVEGIVSGMLADAGKVKDVHVNNTTVLNTEGIAKIDLTKYVTGEELPDFDNFVESGDLPDFDKFALKGDLPDFNNFITAKYLEDNKYATQGWVEGEIAKAQIGGGGDITIPVVDVRVDGNSVINDDKIANISLKGYALSGHTHNASDITGGTININRLPVGTGSDQVAAGNHKHSEYLTSGDTIENANVAKKLGTTTVGSKTTPIYLNGGTPTECELPYLEDGDITKDYLTTKIGNHYLTGETYKGTVTEVKTGVGLTGGPITSTGTVKVNLSSENSIGTIGTNKVYAVGVDANGKLAVKVPWDDNTDTKYTAGNFISISGTNNAIAVKTGDTNATVAVGNHNHDNVYAKITALSGYVTTGDLTTALGKVPDSATTKPGHYNPGYTGDTVGTAGKYITTLTLDGKGHVTAAATGTPYSHPSVEHIPTGGEKGQFLGWDSAGKAKWVGNPDTWRPVQCNSTNIGNSTLNLIAGTNVSLSNTNGAITISSTDTDTKYAAGNFISINGTNNAISVNTGDTNTTVAVGNHNHDNVYAKLTALSGYVTTGDLSDALNKVPDSATTKPGHYNPGYTGDTVGTAGKYLTGITLDGKGHVTGVGTGTPYTHPSVEHIPTGGTNGQFLSCDIFGKAKWVNNPNSDTNYYLTGVTGHGNSSVTLGVKGYGNVTWDASHNHGNAEYTDTKVTSVDNHYPPKATVTEGTTSGNTYIRALNLDAKGHVCSIATGTPTDTNTDTHYNSYNVVCANSIGVQNNSATNGKVTLNHIENNGNTASVTSSHSIVGTGTVSVTADSNGKITISGTNTNTDTNYYLKTVSGSGNGSVTFTREGLDSLTWDASHNHDGIYLKSHQTLYNLSFSGGTFSALTYTPNATGKTVNIPTSTSHITNDSGFITLDDINLSGYVKTTEAQSISGTKTFNDTVVVSGTSANAVTGGTSGWIKIQGYGVSAYGGGISWVKGNGFNGINLYINNNQLYLNNSATTGQSGYVLTSGNINDYLGDAPTTDEKVKSTSTTATTKYYLLGHEASGDTTDSAYKHLKVFMSGGTLNADAFYQNSDETLKDFHGDIDVDFDKIQSIPKKYYTWKGEEDGELQLGTSAQKLQEVYPELVGTNGETLTVDYARLSIVALKAIDKLHEENQMLRNELNEIKKHLGL